MPIKTKSNGIAIDNKQNTIPHTDIHLGVSRFIAIAKPIIDIIKPNSPILPPDNNNTIIIPKE